MAVRTVVRMAASKAVRSAVLRADRMVSWLVECWAGVMVVTSVVAKADLKVGAMVVMLGMLSD
jgi:hypothetical protein